MYQKMIIAGNVGNPESGKSESGKSFVRFGVATGNGKNQDGSEKDPTWFNCLLSDRLADVLGEYVEKGRKVLVEGRIGFSMYESEKDGVVIKRQNHTVFVDTLKFLSSSAKAGDGEDDGVSDASSQLPEEGSVPKFG